MKLTYTFSNIGKGNSLKSQTEAIKSCDEAAKAMQDMLIITGKIVGGAQFVTWLMAHCYTRKLTKNEIEYNFWLLGFFEKFAKSKSLPEK